MPALWQTTTVPDWSKRSLTGRSVLERLTAPAQQGTGGCQQVDTLQATCRKAKGGSLSAWLGGLPSCTGQALPATGTLKRETVGSIFIAEMHRSNSYEAVSKGLLHT